MNVEAITHLQLASLYDKMTTEALARGLITKTYQKNAISLARHVGRQVIVLHNAEDPADMADWIKREQED